MTYLYAFGERHMPSANADLNGLLAVSSRIARSLFIQTIHSNFLPCNFSPRFVKPVTTVQTPGQIWQYSPRQPQLDFYSQCEASSSYLPACQPWYLAMSYAVTTSILIQSRTPPSRQPRRSSTTAWSLLTSATPTLPQSTASTATVQRLVSQEFAPAMRTPRLYPTTVRSSGRQSINSAKGSRSVRLGVRATGGGRSGFRIVRTYVLAYQRVSE